MSVFNEKGGNNTLPLFCSPPLGHHFLVRSRTYFDRSNSQSRCGNYGNIVQRDHFNLSNHLNQSFSIRVENRVMFIKSINLLSPVIWFQNIAQPGYIERVLSKLSGKKCNYVARVWPQQCECLKSQNGVKIS